MRNVLIYFDVATKREILRRTRESLEPDGYLVLGGAETTWNVDDGYVPVQAGNTIVYQPQPIEQRRTGGGR
jgi:chemotaxis protein methyltransferase CheR